jgi:hypothetical protein
MGFSVEPTGVEPVTSIMPLRSKCAVRHCRTIYSGESAFGGYTEGTRSLRQRLWGPL